MTENNSLNILVWKEQLAGFKALAKKYGLAMIMLTANNYVTAIALILAAAVISAIIGVDFFAEGTDLSYWSTMILNELAAYGVPILVLRAMFKKERTEFIPDRTYKPIPFEALLMFMAGMTSGAIGTIVTEAINSVIDSLFGTGEIEDVFTGMEPANTGQYVIFSLCICVVAPIAEEYIFRDLLLKPLRAYGDMTAAVVTGLIFGLYHGNFDQFAYASVLGFFYSVIAIKYNSIIPTIICHAANNTLVTTSNYLSYSIENESEQVKAICTTLSDICAMGATFVMLGGIAGLVIVIARKCFSLHNHNIYVPEPHALIDFVKTPWAAAGLVVMLTVFFIP